ncbi:MAG: hypothetical protein GY795_00985 [Desulfobacterales bacterium]|nr:hypothetical protein [Desulfobacterales bacterium]
MGIRFDLMKLPDSTKKRMVKAIKGYRKMYPNIELVVIDKAPGVMRALEYHDFNIILFMGEEPWETANRKRFNQPQLCFHEYGFRIEVINSYYPGPAYEKVERIPAESEARLLSFNNYRVGREELGNFQKFLYNNLFCYKPKGKGDMSSITTINVPAMRSDNRKFYQIYKTNLLELGYMAYHKELKTVPFIHFPVGEKPIPEPIRKK